MMLEIHIPNLHNASSTIVVCQGRPLCNNVGEVVTNAQALGCLMCKRLFVFEDGTEYAVDPLED